MKKLLFIVICFVGLNLAPSATCQAQIPLIDIIKAAVKKVVKAIDLQIQRQQNKVVWLQNAQKTLENAMAKLKLKDISEWSEKTRKMYANYYQELWKVKAAINNYNKVKGLVTKQVQLVAEYKHAWNLLRQDKNFSPKELEAMFQVYSGIVDESMKNIDQLLLVANSFVTQMSDGKRLELISNASKGIDENLSALRKFNKRNFRLSLSRASDNVQLLQLKKLYGLP